LHGGLISAKDTKGRCSWYCYMQTSSCPEQKREPCYFMLFRINVAIVALAEMRPLQLLLICLNMILFSSPDSKCHVSYYHHLASVVRPSSVRRPSLIRGYYGPWQPCWLTDRNESSNTWLDHANEHSCHVWSHLRVVTFWTD
jgi:hypothetical protein